MGRRKNTHNRRGKPAHPPRRRSKLDRGQSLAQALTSYLARQTEPRMELANINDIVRSTVALVRYQAKAAGVTVRELYDETMPVIPVDSDQIKQVFLNVMTNAIQAMPKGGELKVATGLGPPKTANQAHSLHMNTPQ